VTAKTWGIYSLETGIFRSVYSGPEATIDEQLREGEAAIEGDFDTALVRVNLETKAVEPFIPPSPGPDYQWDDRRWSLTPEAAASLAKREAAEREIQTLEASQARAVREFILGAPDAKDRLTATDAAIAALRLDLR